MTRHLPHSPRRLSLAVALLSLAGLVTACGGDGGQDAAGRERLVDVPMAAGADGTAEPGKGNVIVSMGDSYIAGTAGRWAGNSNGYTNLPRNMEAFGRSDTGDNAYDNYGQPTIDMCFRSRSAGIHLGEPWVSRNIACSGAKTNTVQRDEYGAFKPGIDDAGQLAFLRDVAASGDVTLVVLSLGGNDFAFGDVVEACAVGFLTSLSVPPSYCSDDPEVTSLMGDAAAMEVRALVAGAIGRIVSTMRELGYDDAAWDMVVQNYPSPLPPSSAIRYEQSGDGRQSTGGCPYYDRDLDWFEDVLRTVNGTVARAIADARSATGRDIIEMDVSRLFEGRRLCETGAKLVEETSNADEQRRFSERVEQLRLTAGTEGSPYSPFEAIHPNHYGQLALRACLRQVFNEGDARSGSCGPPADWGAVDSRGEPVVVFTAS
jgi:hypothetical protein